MQGQHSARHLDDPIRPFAGLTVGQLLSLLLGAGAGFGTYRLSLGFPSPNGLVTELTIFLVIAVAAAVACVGMLLAGGQGEPFGAQAAAYLRRCRRYAPAPAQAAPRRRPWRRTPTDSRGLLFMPAGTPAHDLGGIRIAPDGLVTLPDGDLRLYLGVEPVNFDCCSSEDRDLYAACWSRVAALLPPGQRLQVLIENRPLQPAAILDKIRRDLRPDRPALEEFVAASTAWWEQQLVRGHVPDHRFTLVLAPGPNRLKQFGRTPRSPELQRASARRNLDELARTIEHTFRRRRMGCRRLQGEEALQLLWDGLHPGGSPCPSLADLSQEEGSTSAAVVPAPTAGRRSTRRAVILAVPLVLVPVAVAAAVVLAGRWPYQDGHRPGTVLAQSGVLTLTTPRPGVTSVLAVTLTDRAGAAIPGAVIRVTVGGRTLQTARTGATGVATFTYQAGAGPLTVRITAMVGGRQVATSTIQLGAAAPISTSPVTGRFFASNNACTFTALATKTPLFVASFPTLNFGGRPFTGYAGTAEERSVRAAGGEQTAGLGKLDHFDAVFTGNFLVSHPGNQSFTVLIDDAFNLGIGGGARRVRGTLSNPPANGLTALRGLPVVGAFNQGHLQATTTVTVYFPHAGSYPYEVDYAECDGGGESLRISTEGRFLPETATGGHHAAR